MTAKPIHPHILNLLIALLERPDPNKRMYTLNGDNERLKFRQVYMIVRHLH